MQRFFDIIFSATALLVSSPILLIVGLVLRFTGESEIFYTQSRVGKNGSVFNLYKFATMLKNSADIGTGTVTIKDDYRVLPVGKFLRKTKINEIPQLLNILNGDMSIIGPRPQTQRCFAAFSQEHRDAIIQVRPGLSGVGSVVFSNEEALLHDKQDALGFYDNVIAPYKGYLEKWYVMHHNLGVYFKLIFLTIIVIVFRNKNLVWTVFPDIQYPPEVLRQDMGLYAAGTDTS